MTMTKKVMEEKAHALRDLENRSKALETQIDLLKKEFKKEMEHRGVDVLQGEDWEVSWKTISSSRFDQSAFKDHHPKLFEKYKVLSESRRFTCR